MRPGWGEGEERGGEEIVRKRTRRSSRRRRRRKRRPSLFGWWRDGCRDSRDLSAHRTLYVQPIFVIIIIRSRLFFYRESGGEEERIFFHDRFDHQTSCGLSTPGSTAASSARAAGRLSAEMVRGVAECSHLERDGRQKNKLRFTMCGVHTTMYDGGGRLTRTRMGWDLEGRHHVCRKGWARKERKKKKK